MNNILDSFDEWKVDATPRNYPDVKVNGTVEKGTAVDGASIRGVFWNKSDAERYFSQTWASDVSDIFATDNAVDLNPDSFLVYDSIEYTVDSVVDVAKQGEVWLIGLKVIQ